MYRRIAGALIGAALLLGGLTQAALAQSAAMLGRKTATEYVYDVPLPADFAGIVTGSDPKYARFKTYLKSSTEESGGQQYEILTARISWDRGMIDKGEFAVAGDHGARGADWVKVDISTAEWQALLPHIMAAVTANGGWSNSEFKIYVPPTGGPATLIVPIPELTLIKDRMKALEPATVPGTYYPGVKRPADLKALQAEMLNFGNVARRDPDYRKKYKTKAAYDLSGDTVRTMEGVEKIYKQNPTPPYFADVRLNEDLNEAAQFQAEYQASIDTMTHDGPASYRDPSTGADVDMTHASKRSLFFGGPGNVVEAAGGGKPGDYPHAWMVTDTHYRPWFEIAATYPEIGFGAALSANGNWYFVAVPVFYSDGVAPGAPEQPAPVAEQPVPVAEAAKVCSPPATESIVLTFVNTTAETVSFHWMEPEPDCKEGGGPVLAPGGRENGQVNVGNIFRVRGQDGRDLGLMTVEKGKDLVFGDGVCSPPASESIVLTFVNNTAETVSFHWMEPDCKEGGGPVLAPGARENGQVNVGNIFRVRGQDGREIGLLTVEKGKDLVVP